MKRAARPPMTNWEADFAALSEQVTGLEADYRDLKIGVANLDKKIDTAFASLSLKFDSRSVTPWGTIIAGLAFILTGMTTIGYLARQPIVSQVSSISSELQRNAELRRIEDRRLADHQLKLQSQVDRMQGAFDLIINQNLVLKK